MHGAQTSCTPRTRAAKRACWLGCDGRELLQCPRLSTVFANMSQLPCMLAEYAINLWCIASHALQGGSLSGLGVSMIDALSTLWLMGLRTDFWE